MKRIYIAPHVIVVNVEIEGHILSASNVDKMSVDGEDVEAGGNFSGVGGVEINSFNVWDHEW